MFQPKYSIILANVGMWCRPLYERRYSVLIRIDEMFARVASVDGG